MKLSAFKIDVETPQREFYENEKADKFLSQIEYISASAKYLDSIEYRGPVNHSAFERR